MPTPQPQEPPRSGWSCPRTAAARHCGGCPCRRGRCPGRAPRSSRRAEGDVVVRPRPGEHRRVDRCAVRRGLDLPDDAQLTRVDRPGDAAGRTRRPASRRCRSASSARSSPLRTLMRTLSCASPSMRSSPPRPSMRSVPAPPMRMLPPVKVVAPPRTALRPATRAVPCRSQLVVHHRGGVTVVTPQGVVEVPPGQRLDEVEPVLVRLHARRQQAREVHVGVRRRRVGVVRGVVEPEHALTALDAGTEQHDVVAALTVVVGLAAVADEHVVAGLVRVVLERGAVVALEQVERAATGAGDGRTALDPVVAVVAEDRVVLRRRRARSRRQVRRTPPPCRRGR